MKFCQIRKTKYQTPQDEFNLDCRLLKSLRAEVTCLNYLHAVSNEKAEVVVWKVNLTWKEI